MVTTTERMRRIARASALWRVWWALWIACGLLLATGCGGSYVDDDTDGDTDNRPAVCRHNPRACA